MRSCERAVIEHVIQEPGTMALYVYYNRRSSKSQICRIDGNAAAMDSIEESLEPPHTEVMFLAVS